MGLELALCHRLWSGEGRRSGRRRKNKAEKTWNDKSDQILTVQYRVQRDQCLGATRQRARAMIRLAHISKKSMVWLPRRGVTEGMVPTKEPLREPIRDWHSAAAAASMLSLGRCKPAAEQERWGVEEPDLCSITSS